MFLYVPESFALAVRNSTERDGLVLDEHLATVCQLSEDKISAITTYSSNVDMVNLFIV